VNDTEKLIRKLVLRRHNKLTHTHTPNSYMPERLLFSLFCMVLKQDFRSQGYSECVIKQNSMENYA